MKFEIKDKIVLRVETTLVVSDSMVLEGLYIKNSPLVAQAGWIWMA